MNFFIFLLEFRHDNHIVRKLRNISQFTASIAYLCAILVKRNQIFVMSQPDYAIDFEAEQISSEKAW